MRGITTDALLREIKGIYENENSDATEERIEALAKEFAARAARGDMAALADFVDYMSDDMFKEFLSLICKQDERND